MKTILRLSWVLALPLCFVLSFSACDKDDDKDSNTGNSACAGGVAFCMEYGSTNKSGAATLSQPLGGRYRVYWEKTAGGSFEQVELDIYGSATGTYSIDTTGATGTAVFEYFSTTGGANKGVSGTLTVSQFDPNGNGLTGTFTVGTADGTLVKNGHFVNVTP